MLRSRVRELCSAGTRSALISTGSLWKLVILALLFGVLIGTGLITTPLDSLARGQTQTRSATPRGALTMEEESRIDLFERLSPSVVHITSLARRRNLRSLNVTEIPQGSGSGMIWDTQGHIVTNFHVLDGGERFDVTLGDDSRWEGRVVGFAAGLDMAVLKIDAPADRLRPIPLGTSGDLRVGQDVLAIGNPFGLDQTLTTGIVSALGRTINAPNGRELRDMIQTDAAINPGNSGGPLLDAAGRVIGMNAAIQSPSGASAGISFAVPVDEIRDVIPELIAYGQVVRPVMGVMLMDDRIVARSRLRGAVIERVLGGSPADRAGLRGVREDEDGDVYVGDIIVGIDEQRVSSGRELTTILEAYEAGDEIELALQRGREVVRVTLRLTAPDAVNED